MKIMIMDFRKNRFLLIKAVAFLVFYISACNKQNHAMILPDDPEQKNKTEINVLTFKPSSTSDHEMIQKAVDYAAQNRIPVVYIPAGEYKIEASTGNVMKGISLRDNIHLKLHDKAVLSAIPNSSPNYAVLLVKSVSKVKITGGRINGERNRHTGTGGEWGMGIHIVDSRAVEVRNMLITDCWGDAIYVGGNRASTNVSIDKVRCENNRRQGISVVNCDGMVIKNSLFSFTKGTAPQAGIDLEPNKGQAVQNVKVDSCTFIGNTGVGFFIYAAAGFVSDIELKNSYFENNAQAGVNLTGGAPMTADIKNLKNVTVSSVKTHKNPFVGISINDADNVSVDDITVTESAKTAVRIEKSVNIGLSNMDIRNFVENGIHVLNADGVKLSSGTLFAEKINTNGVKLENSKNLEVISMSTEGGKFGIYGKKNTHLTVRSIKLKKQSENSLYIEDCSLGEFKNNFFATSSREAFVLFNANDFEISHNTFSNDGTGATDVAAYVSFLGNSSKNKFIQNSILKNSSGNKPLYGIYLAKQSSSNNISGNTISADSYSVTSVKDEGLNNQVLTKSISNH